MLILLLGLRQLVEFKIWVFVCRFVFGLIGCSWLYYFRQTFIAMN